MMSMLAVLALGSGAVLGLPAGTAAGPPASPNVILIFADDAAYNEIGYVDDNDFLTPRIDALASESFVCTQGYVALPTCSPSRAALLTGLYPQRFGYERNISNDLDVVEGLTPDDEILPEWFKDLGYATGVIGKWHLGSMDDVNRPLDKGVDDFFGVFAGSRPYWGGINVDKKVMRRGDLDIEDVWVSEGDPGDYDPVNGRYVTDAFGDEAAAFIDKHHDEPFFLYVPFTAPHEPLQAKQEDLDQFPMLSGDTKVRAAMTLAMDRAVGKILDALAAHQLEEETIVVFLNDNGGPGGTDNGPFRGEKGTLWEGGVRVPFFIYIPWLQGGAVDAPVCAIDLAPTLLAAAGASLAYSDGVDLMPFLDGSDPGLPHDRLRFRFENRFAILDGPWKYTRPNANQGIYLYNLDEDLGEQINVAGQHPDIVAELQLDLDLWEAGLAKPKWGILGEKDQNTFDHFRFDVSSDAAFSDEGAWIEAGTQNAATLLPADAYANAIFEFGTSDTPYHAANDMKRMTGLTFMLNELRLSGQFAGAQDSSTLIDGNPLLFVDSLDGDPAAIRCSAQVPGGHQYTFEVANDIVMLDDFSMLGNGAARFVLTGDATERLPGRSVTKKGTSTISIAGNWSFTGALDVAAGTLDVDGGALDGPSVVQIDAGATLHLEAGAISAGSLLAASGTLEGSGEINAITHNSGLVDPAGTISIANSYVQHADGQTPGKLKIDVDGEGNVDQIIVGQSAVLNGILHVSFADDYEAVSGQSFKILSAGAVIGAFSSIEFSGLPPQYTVTAASSAKDVIVVVRCLADVNADGVLNILDFVAFQQGFVASDPSADCDGNATFNTLDFICYQELFVAGCG